MSSNYNEEFFDRYLHNECSADEAVVFEEACENDNELSSAFEQFREYRELVTGANTISASDDFTDKVVREIRLRADERKFSWKTLYNGFFSREVAGVVATMLILAVVFWPQMRSVVAPLEETVSIPEVTYSEAPAAVESYRKEKEVAVQSEAAEEKTTIAAAQEKAVEKKVLRKAKPAMVESVKGGGAVGVADASRSKQAVEGAAPTVQPEMKQREQVGYDADEVGFAASAPKAKMSRQATPTKELEEMSRKREVKKDKAVAVTEDEVLYGYYDRADNEVELLAIEKSSERTESFEAEERVRGFEEKSEAQYNYSMKKSVPAEVVADTLVLAEEDTAEFPFDRYNATVTGIDTLTVTLPAEELRGFVRAWEREGGTVIDTVEQDEEIILRVLK